MMEEQDYQAVRKVLLDTLEQLQTARNDALEEVALEFDKMVPFGDTAQSFATYVRMMKK